MKILLDHCVPKSLATALNDFSVTTARQAEMDQLQNGRLLAAAAAAQFQVLITTDRGFAHQQNIAAQPLMIILLKVHPNTPENLARLHPQLITYLNNYQASCLHILSDDNIIY